jgi:hypothetical protein
MQDSTEVKLSNWMFDVCVYGKNPYDEVKFEV